LENAGQTVVGVVVAGCMVGIIALADQVKPDSAQAVAGLRQLGFDPVMITGDNERVARAVADQVGITQVVANVLPDGKVEMVRALQQHGETVAMVGDGLNDAPALTQAQVGIAIGTGTDLALEAADLAVVQGNLSAVVRAIRLSQTTFRKIRQNLWWAYSYNLLAIPLAALGILHPIMAEVAMALSSLNVIWNSLRIRQEKLS
jgi:Cu+-exporting ATPase